MVLSLSLVSVEGASFDGTYNYAYNLNGPGGWETHQVDKGFIVRNGRVSSNPSAFSGTVDSGGNVYFTGPSPYGSPSATFTGVIYSDGTGDGTYQDSQGLGGRWSVARVSGGGGFSFMGIVDTLLSLLYSFSFIGEAVGLSGTTAAAVGSAAVIFVVVSVIAIVTTRASGRGKRAVMDDRGKDGKPWVRYEFSQQRPYEASEAPPGAQETPASFIGVPPPRESPPVGLHVEGRALPERLDLRSAWLGGQVNLSWDRPPYDPEKYELLGYEVTSCSTTVAAPSPAGERRSSSGPTARVALRPIIRPTGGTPGGISTGTVWTRCSGISTRIVRIGLFGSARLRLPPWGEAASLFFGSVAWCGFISRRGLYGFWSPVV